MPVSNTFGALMLFVWWQEGHPACKSNTRTVFMLAQARKTVYKITTCILQNSADRYYINWIINDGVSHSNI